jgi:glycosyltransferase involved in cell wall biosynthesis
LATVKFFDWLTEEELYGAMSSAAAFALLSEREGFGMVVLEAMAGGTPVVVATGTNTAAPDLVTNGMDGFVTPPDPAAISGALASLVNDRALSARMGEAGKRKAADYSWDQITERTESLYMALAGRPAVADMASRELDEAA